MQELEIIIVKANNIITIWVHPTMGIMVAFEVPGVGEAPPGVPALAETDISIHSLNFTIPVRFTTFYPRLNICGTCLHQCTITSNCPFLNCPVWNHIIMKIMVGFQISKIFDLVLIRGFILKFRHFGDRRYLQCHRRPHLIFTEAGRRCNNSLR